MNGCTFTTWRIECMKKWENLQEVWMKCIFMKNLEENWKKQKEIKKNVTNKNESYIKEGYEIYISIYKNINFHINI